MPHSGPLQQLDRNHHGPPYFDFIDQSFKSYFHHRLNPILEEENVLCKEQAGFRKNHRTTDHIFLLKRIIKTYISKNKYLYTCFVDFSKAFDSIWREGLIKKNRKYRN